MLLGAIILSADLACRTEVVAPETGARRDAFLGWLARSGVAWDGSDLLEEGSSSRSLDLRVADIDNDGADEYVLSTVQGSGAYLSVWVFRPAGDAWTYVPQTPLWEGEDLSHDYRDPETGGSRLLERFCGRTYVNLLGGEAPHLSKLSSLWSKGAVETPCDAAWLREQRRQFQSLFDRKRYGDAQPLLEGTAACAPRADPDLWAWLQSDLALTALRMGAYQDCLDVVARAEKSQVLARAGGAARGALRANARLCEEGRQRARSASGPGFGWLLELKSDPGRQAVLDPRFPALLSAIVPDATVDGEALRDIVTRALWVPEDARVSDDRYVLLSGCRPHDCSTKAFAWVDVVGRKGLVGVGDVLASTGFSFASIPWSRLRDAALVPWGMEVDFIDARGRRTRVHVPAE